MPTEEVPLQEKAINTASIENGLLAAILSGILMPTHTQPIQQTSPNKTANGLKFSKPRQIKIGTTIYHRPAA